MAFNELFFVDGAERNFADIIVEVARCNDITEKVTISTFGISSAQIEKIMAVFSRVLIVVDQGQSKLNTSMFARCVKIDSDIDRCVIKVCKTHAKLALVGGKILIISSANLTKNYKKECYYIKRVSPTEIENINQLLSGSCPISDYVKKESISNSNVEEDGIDICLDLDFL